MSRWGFAAFAAALAAVIAIGMVAIRISDRTSSTVAETPSPTPTDDASSPTRPDTEPSDRRGARTVSRQRGTEREPVGAQLRRLKRDLDSSGGLDDVEEFFVTLSLRRPLPLTIANGRRTPLPDGLSDATLFTLYTEARDGTPAQVRTPDLADTRGLGSAARTPAPNRVVVLGMSMPVGEYRDLKPDLRSLPVESRVVGSSSQRADYVPRARFGTPALRSWKRFYRS